MKFNLTYPERIGNWRRELGWIRRVAAVWQRRKEQEYNAR
jgi:hypothetical protein